MILTLDPQLIFCSNLSENKLSGRLPYALVKRAKAGLLVLQ